MQRTKKLRIEHALKVQDDKDLQKPVKNITEFKNLLQLKFKKEDHSRFIEFNNIFEVNLLVKMDTAKFEETFKNNEKDEFKQHYIWVGLNKDNVIFVVGRSSFSNISKTYGDLFSKYSVFGIVSQEILLRMNLTHEELSVLENANDKINSYITTAYVIPLKIDSSLPQADIASECETIIGDILSKKYTIFNLKSHLYY